MGGSGSRLSALAGGAAEIPGIYRRGVVAEGDSEAVGMPALFL